MLCARAVAALRDAGLRRRAPAVHRVHERHHRQAEGRGARPAGFVTKIAEEVGFQADCRSTVTGGDRDDVLFWLTDLGWIMGPWQIFGTLAWGATMFCYDGAPDPPCADRLWAMVERHAIAILGMSPTLVRALMAHGDAPVRAHDVSSLRVLGSTGEPWNEGPWWWYFRTVGGERCPVINVSGGTEVGCFLAPHVVEPIAPCSLGGPALGCAVDVVDDECNPVRGVVGELICRRPWPAMTRGMWKEPDRYIETYWSRWPGVWWHGDWASIDADGRWFLHGRSDDTIKLAGKRLGPAEVETALVEHPAVVEAAAIGMPRAQGREAGLLRGGRARHHRRRRAPRRSPPAGGRRAREGVHALGRAR